MIFPMIEIRYLVVPVGQTPYQMQKAGFSRPSVIQLRQFVSFDRPYRTQLQVRVSKVLAIAKRSLHVLRLRTKESKLLLEMLRYGRT